MCCFRANFSKSKYVDIHFLQYYFVEERAKNNCAE